MAKDMIMTDMKEMDDIKNPVNNTIVKTSVTGKIASWWLTIQRYGLIITIAIALGVWIGITVSGNFQAQKMDDVIATEAMVYKGKVYTLTPR